uniref:Uncharacterized protein n=1 Tax=Mycena chlorophos TaxID=658473 RepID=A0ABQ0MCI6_MYCCL|nr:predicted protein [Mycena chlorophos]
MRLPIALIFIFVLVLISTSSTAAAALPVGLRTSHRAWKPKPEEAAAMLGSDSRQREFVAHEAHQYRPPPHPVAAGDPSKPTTMSFLRMLFGSLGFEEDEGRVSAEDRRGCASDDPH